MKISTTHILLPAFNFNGQSLKLPDECGPTISDHTKQHCRNKRSMITPEAWTPVIINSQCSSIKWIERSTKYVLPRIQVFIMYVRKPRRVFRLLTSDFQLPTSDLRLHTSNFRLQTWQSANSGFLISDRSDFRTSHFPLPTSEPMRMIRATVHL